MMQSDQSHRCPHAEISYSWLSENALRIDSDQTVRLCRLI